MSKYRKPDDLRIIHGVGVRIASKLHAIGIKTIADLMDKNPETIYELSNLHEGEIQDRCLLYVFREAVYFARTPHPDPKKLQWWYWKDTICKNK